MILIDGKKIRDQILAIVGRETASLPFCPIFCDVLVGEDPSSKQYVAMKAKFAESVGMKFYKSEFSSSASTKEIESEIRVLNKIPDMCGVIVQLPLPSSIDREAILGAIDSVLDVDFLGLTAGKEFYEKYQKMPSTLNILNVSKVTFDITLGPPAALACVSALDSLGLDLSKKEIVVLGQGELVGRPVAAILARRGFFVKTIVSDTTEKESILKKADVVISGIGKPGYIKGEIIKEGAILIDAGTSESAGGIVGDVDFESVKNVAGYLSPTPGGVGPITVAMLLKNVLKVAQDKIK